MLEPIDRARALRMAVAALRQEATDLHDAMPPGAGRAAAFIVRVILGQAIRELDDLVCGLEGRPEDSPYHRRAGGRRRG